MQEIVGVFIGNSILSTMGLIFALGAPISEKYKIARFWWIVFWIGLLVFYMWRLLFSSITVSNQIIINLISTILSGISTIAVAIMYLTYYKQKKLSLSKAIFLCGLLFIFICIIETIIISATTSLNNWQGIFSQILAWLLFVLFAWSYRIKHMPTTLLLLAYANLQLPSVIFGGKLGLGNDFVLLLAAKLSLIGAMYHMLGVREIK